MEFTIDQTLEKAVEAHKAGDVSKARHLYSAILKAQPKHPNANHNLGTLAVDIGKPNEALPFLKAALEANPTIAQFWLSYIDALIKLDRNTEAKTVLDQAINFANQKEKDGAREEAKRIYQGALSIFPGNKRAKDGLKRLANCSTDNISKFQEPSQVQIQSLINLYSLGQLEQAINQASTLLKQFPNSVILLNIQGAILTGLGQFDSAVEAFKKALAITPDNAEAFNNMGNTLTKQGMLEEAIEAYKKALVINPSYAEAYYNMGNTRKEQGMLEEAIEAFQKALAITPNYAEAYNNMGVTLREQGMLKEAIAAYKEALAITPNYAEAHNNIGVTFNDQHKLEDAIEAFQKALAITPNYAEAYNNIGNTRKEQGRLEEAIEAYKKALSSRPGYAEAYNNMGNALRKQEKLEEAIEAYKKAIEITPANPEAYNNMGVTLNDQRKLEEAMDAYKKALAIRPDYSAAYNNMGITLKEQGRLDDAIGALQEALAIKHDYAEAYNNMGNALREQGKLEGAIDAYRKALGITPENAECVENFQSLAVQLLPSIANHGYDFDTSRAQVSSEIALRPMYQMQLAIKAYLEGDFSLAHSHNNNFKACDQTLLEPKNEVFCNAYSSFIGKLLDAKWDEEHAPENTLYHLGESHSLSYAHRSITITGLRYKIAPRMTFGAKAFHFARPKYDAFKAITKTHFASLPKSSNVFISYGEIDCRPNEGFISAAKKHDQPLEELIDHTAAGYVKWFSDQNVDQEHNLYFFNVPAPVYNNKYSADLNSTVARAITLFNHALKKYSLQHGFDTVDVFKFTTGKDGFSNGLFHIDRNHLGEKALKEIQRQLS